MDLNHRPHAYQACALNHLSYRPIIRKILGLSKLNMMSVWKFVYVFIHMPFSLERR